MDGDGKRKILTCLLGPRVGWGKSHHHPSKRTSLTQVVLSWLQSGCVAALGWGVCCTHSPFKAKQGSPPTPFLPHLSPTRPFLREGVGCVECSLSWVGESCQGPPRQVCRITFTADGAVLRVFRVEEASCTFSAYSWGQTQELKQAVPLHASDTHHPPILVPESTLVQGCTSQRGGTATTCPAE